MPQENQPPLPAPAPPVTAAQSAGDSTPRGAYNVGGPAGGAPKMTMLSKLLGHAEGHAAGATGSQNGSSSRAQPLEGQSGNAFTKLFGAVSATPKGPGAPVSLSKLLGPKPIFAQKAYAEAAAKKKRTAKILLDIAVVAALVTYGFFQSQLHPNFTLLINQIGPNVRMNFDRSNEELEAIQTDINVVRFKKTRVLLDEVNADIDSFLSNTAIAKSDLSTPSEKSIAQDELQILGSNIKNALKEVQTMFAKPLGIDTYSLLRVTPEERDARFQVKLVAAINEEKDALAKQANPDLEQLRIFDNVRRLVENKSFRDTVIMQDLGKITETDFAAMLQKIREQATDELSSIVKIRSKRPRWTTVIAQIHDVALRADPLYGKGFFKVQGGLLFSSYRFDAATKRISITGLSKQSDSLIFSQIANLVENIDRSPYFKDIDFRSFSKSRDEGGNFSSSINLEFSLEKDSQDDSIELKTAPSGDPIVQAPT